MFIYIRRSGPQIGFLRPIIGLSSWRHASSLFVQLLAELRVPRHWQLHWQCQSVESARVGGGAQDCGARVEHWLRGVAPGSVGLHWRGRVLLGDMLGQRRGEIELKLHL